MGSALFEDAAVDMRFCAFVNHDLAEYHVPSHVDTPAGEAVFLDEVNDKTNPLKICFDLCHPPTKERTPGAPPICPTPRNRQVSERTTRSG